MFTRLSITYIFCASFVVATCTLPVKLDGATVNGKTSGFVQEFLGIRFAQPP